MSDDSWYIDNATVARKRREDKIIAARYNKQNRKNLIASLNCAEVNTSDFYAMVIRREYEVQPHPSACLALEVWSKHDGFGTEDGIRQRLEALC